MDAELLFLFLKSIDLGDIFISLPIHITEPVVAESVVAIRRLLQQRPLDALVMITQLTKALDEITEPLARANVFWLVGQFCSQLPLVAPDVLRKAAKTFCSEVKTNCN